MAQSASPIATTRHRGERASRICTASTNGTSYSRARRRTKSFCARVARPNSRRLSRSTALQYASRAGLNAHADRGLLVAEQLPAYEQRERVWQSWITIRYLAGYLDVAGGSPLVPEDRDDLRDLLTAYTLDKALYEVSYELRSRPDWLHVPLRGVLQIASSRVGEG